MGAKLRYYAASAVAFFAAVLPLKAEWRLETSQCVGATDSPAVFCRKIVSGDRAVELRVVSFDKKKCTLKVIDNPDCRENLADAMEKSGCLAGVNGNYFQSDRTPIGLVISNGRTLHPMERAKLLTGLIVVAHGRVSLLRTSEHHPSDKIDQALQSGPFLVDRGMEVRGLNDSRRADRTVVLSDGHGHCALLVCGPVSLAEMARILCIPGLTGEMQVVRALNLDGGSSTAIWVKNPSYYRRELKPVRNFLGVILK